MFLPEAYLAGGIASLFIGRRIWVMSRRSRNNYLLRRPIAARLEHWLHRRMHALLGNSSAVCADLSAEGAPSARIGMLRNGMAIGGPRESREQTRARLNLVLDAPVLLVVANLLPYKGHADLLRAMALAVSALPEATVLLVAGADRGEGRALAALASAAGIERSCRWLGPRDDVAELMQAADVLIHPAHEEGSPNVVLEAMAAGLAVIATDVGGTAELLGEVGLLVPARDPTALAAAIIQLVTDQHLRTTLATSGRARASAEFSLEACVARYCALYAGLAVGAAPRDLLPWEHF
jgi:glycosyltransferase involved in cell wall biosynthesis